MASTLTALLDHQSPKEIRSRSCPACHLCGATGNLVYEGVPDRLFGAPGFWNFKLCTNPNCGLIWLDPTPLEEEIGKAYENYYTHAEVPEQRTKMTNALRKCASFVFSLADPVRGERKSLSLMFLDKGNPGRLLDVGCGNGMRLAQLRSLGWDAYGQDVDPTAVAYARETLGLEIHLGRLEDIPFAEKSFDCITLNHVIEHTHDPVGLLRGCRRLLREGGLLVVVTPNASSFACRHFGPFWRGLEPPRHIHIFSPRALSAAAARAGFTVSSLSTTVANARSFGRASLSIRNGGSSLQTLPARVKREIHSLAHFYRSIYRHWIDAGSGEECVLQATY